MRNLLTIGEVANLLDINASQVRYYDKENLLIGNEKSESGYRLFDYKDLDRIEEILILRELGIPLKDIKEIYKSNKIGEYKNALYKAKIELKKQIKELRQTLKMVEGKIEYIENFKLDHIEIIQYPDRFLKIIDVDQDPSMNVKKLYDFIKSYELIYRDYETPLYFIYDNETGNETFLIEDTKNKHKKFNLKEYIIREGTFARVTREISPGTKLDLEVENIKKFFKDKDINVIGEPIVINNHQNYFVRDNKLYVLYEIRIKDM